MADRTAAATAKIAALRQKLAAAEARSRSRREICALQRLPICVNAWLHLFAICRGRDPVEG